MRTVTINLSTDTSMHLRVRITPAGRIVVHQYEANPRTQRTPRSEEIMGCEFRNPDLNSIPGAMIRTLAGMALVIQDDRVDSDRLVELFRLALADLLEIYGYANGAEAGYRLRRCIIAYMTASESAPRRKAVTQ